VAQEIPQARKPRCDAKYLLEWPRRFRPPQAFDDELDGPETTCEPSTGQRSDVQGIVDPDGILSTLIARRWRPSTNDALPRLVAVETTAVVRVKALPRPWFLRRRVLVVLVLRTDGYRRWPLRVRCGMRRKLRRLTVVVLAPAKESGEPHNKRFPKKLNQIYLLMTFVAV
jgi:hypothetical protein